MKQINTKVLIAALILTIIFIGAAATGCSSKKTTLIYDFNTETAPAPAYPNVTFAVITDTHIYDASLGSSGQAFEDMMISDRKLLLDSIDLLDFAIDNILAAQVDFVLISGDLTKDSEVINHNIMSAKLRRLKDANIAVFVVPGNHDVTNPDAERFIGDKTEPVPVVSIEDFAEIYGDFGYNNAIMRDTDSLSYVAEPVEGLWVLALEACRHRENEIGKKAYVSGKISQETADWIASVLRQANSQNKAVMAFMHHGVVEHWKGQSKLHSDYLINDFYNFGKFLASWNVRLVFTGHYHAQDITRADFDNGKFIYDVQTGSLVTAPCPIRFLSIDHNILDIRTRTLVDKIYPGTDFAANAQAFVKRTVMLEAASTLRKYKVSEKDIAIIADAVGDAFAAHYSGDENPALRPPINKSRLSLWGRFILSQQQYVLDGLWIDLPPEDNDVILQL